MKVAQESNDAQMSDFIEFDFLTEQVYFILSHTFLNGHSLLFALVDPFDHFFYSWSFSALNFNFCPVSDSSDLFDLYHVLSQCL